MRLTGSSPTSPLKSGHVKDSSGRRCGRSPPQSESALLRMKGSAEGRLSNMVSACPPMVSVRRAPIRGTECASYLERRSGF